MITIQLPNSTPAEYYPGMAVKIQRNSLPEIGETPENDFCYCKFECDYTENVFGSASNDYWKNDKNTFIYRRLIASDTITIKLLKNGVEVATITDNTFGEYIDGYTTGTPDQQLYVVFTIFWQNVFLTFGSGEYTIEAELNILGSTTIQESQKFKLIGYSDLAADGTVRIESYQNGNIIGSEFDFTDLNLYQSFRVKGKLTEITPELENDNYLDTNYKSTQIQTKVLPKWNLNIKKVSRLVSLLITRDVILSNKMEVTDYNIINEAIFRRVNVTVEAIEKLDSTFTTRASYDLTLNDKINNIIKRNN